MPLAWGETIRRAALLGQEVRTMRVTMTEDRTAYPDGVTATQLEEGETYELRDDLAKRLINAGYCRAASGKATLSVVPTPSEPQPEPAADSTPAADPHTGTAEPAQEPTAGTGEDAAETEAAAAAAEEAKEESTPAAKPKAPAKSKPETKAKPRASRARRGSR
jgi:hypothetical protein